MKASLPNRVPSERLKDPRERYVKVTTGQGYADLILSGPFTDEGLDARPSERVSRQVQNAVYTE